VKTIAIFLFAWIAIAVASRADNDFVEGNRAYEAGKFAEARQHYEKLVQRGEWSANLFYNLGNTEARMGAAGLASLNYERALVLQPGHSEARANLDFLRRQTGAEVPVRTWREQAFGGFAHDRWLVIAVGAVWVAVFAVVVPFVRRRRLTGGGWSLFVFAFCLAAYAGTGAWISARDRDAGVIVSAKAEVRKAPANGDPPFTNLAAGSRVRIAAVSGDWIFCHLPSSESGWLSRDAAQRIWLTVR
jgi:tetratricopeptide (TPR) repeat protein